MSSEAHQINTAFLCGMEFIVLFLHSVNKFGITSNLWKHWRTIEYMESSKGQNLYGLRWLKLAMTSGNEYRTPGLKKWIILQIYTLLFYAD